MTPRRAATGLPRIYQASDKTYEMRDIVLDILLYAQVQINDVCLFLRHP